MDYSVIHQKVIGISLLPKSENDRLKTAWQDRYNPIDAFWVEAEPGEKGTAVAKKIFNEISQQGIVALAGQGVVLAVFYDLTEEGIQQRVADLDLDHLIAQIGQTGAVMSCVMQFGYLGRMPYDNPELLRGNARYIMESNRHRLCLVAVPILSQNGGNNWKAAIVFLDILRRTTAPEAILPDINKNFKIGFLRYAEYDHEKLTGCQQELQITEKKLNNDNRAFFSANVLDSLVAIGNNSGDQYPINENMQPVHPDLYLSGTIEKWKAGHGTNKKFNMARQQTQLALEQTGLRLNSRIVEDHSLGSKGAEAELIRLFDSSDCGMVFIEDSTAVRKALEMDVPQCQRPMLPSFAYQSSQDYDEKIEGYLTSCRSWGVHEAQRKRLEELREAYDRMIPGLAKKRTDLLDRQGALRMKLQKLQDRQAFLTMVSGSGLQMETCFHPLMGNGQTSKFVIYREDRDAAEIREHCSGIDCFISARTGQLRNMDDAEIKGIHALFFVFDESILKNVIV